MMMIMNMTMKQVLLSQSVAHWQHQWQTMTIMRVRRYRLSNNFDNHNRADYSNYLNWLYTLNSFPTA